ncbi:related to light induced alcohol dehydrogenase Bli-4 [Cephalotrichum gorgonifer]|uniref:Related to light induced alcohol dehydrogenase Bli-4 n=1 Tax=Cephalotrichum gorgonifer TaxID=2041049 RepID=A0AAE8SUK0_9PEZI|nr:related to light induced alcohol dehydrogenase Bli-4 [Cephalotrichum gorgonifer]
MSFLSALQGMRSVLYSNLFVKLPVPVGNPDLKNQTFVVTGANTGLGYEASLHLSRLGVGKLIMAVRTTAKGDSARKEILSLTRQPESSIEVWPIDMDSYDSIKAFAARASQLPRLDGVLANAGIMTTQFGLSEGYEKTLNVNFISTFLLYLLLLPKMRESGEKTGHVANYVIPNSALHYMAPLAELDPDSSQKIIDRLNDPRTADMGGRYPLSKLLVIYAVRELAERSGSSGKGACTINTPNPSFCKSSLARESQGSRGFRIFEKLLARSTEEGSRVLVHGLLAGRESNGQYLSNCRVESPASHVTGEWGQRAQKKIFEELLDRLEKVQPGISSAM